MDKAYMALIERFALAPITTKKQYNAAIDLIKDLTARDGKLSPSEIDYGKVLVSLVKTYEQAQLGEFFHKVPGNEVLDYLLEQHSLKQTEAAAIAGVSKQNLNDFLKGRRKLPREASLRLAKHFKLSAGIFELEKELSSA